MLRANLCLFPYTYAPLQKHWPRPSCTLHPSTLAVMTSECLPVTTWHVRINLQAPSVENKSLCQCRSCCPNIGPPILAWFVFLITAPDPMPSSLLLAVDSLRPDHSHMFVWCNHCCHLDQMSCKISNVHVCLHEVLYKFCTCRISMSQSQVPNDPPHCQQITARVDMTDEVKREHGGRSSQPSWKFTFQGLVVTPMQKQF